jgi:hypothetical protein
VSLDVVALFWAVDNYANSDSASNPYLICMDGTVASR